MRLLSVLLDVSGYNPDPSGIPGAGTFMTITNWAAFMGEVGCLISVPCLVGAVLIANAGTLVNTFLHLGLH